MLLLSSSCMASSLLMHSDRVPVSRRLFNLSYSLWVLSLFLIFLVACTLLRFIDLVSSCGGYNLVTLQHLSPEVSFVFIYYIISNIITILYNICMVHIAIPLLVLYCRLMCSVYLIAEY